MSPLIVLVGKKKLIEKKLIGNKNLLVKFLNFCLKINVNSFFEFKYFSQIYKLRQPFINQKNYQKSFYDNFLNFYKYKLKLKTKWLPNRSQMVKMS